MDLQSAIIPAVPAVTWIIPVLNGMPYLKQTLASLEAQTFRDSQVVIWDNGSTDGTVEEARAWIPSRLPGTVVVGRPSTLGGALALLVQEFDTEFCARLDADDLSMPDRLEKQIAFLRANPDIALIGSQMIQMNAAGEDIGRLEYPLSHEEIVREMLTRNPIAHPTVVFRRAAVLATENYHDFSPTHVEDYDLWLRMAAMNFRLANLPEALVRYRIHPGSSTQKSIAAKRIDAEMLRRLQEAAPQLFSCSAKTIGQLKTRKHALAMIPLMRIARHLGGDQSCWRSPVFVRAVRQMIAPRDLLSRAVLSIIGRFVH